MDFISKDDKAKIDALNKVLGTRYRSTPYDFTKTNDIIKATTMITAEYLDFLHYWSQLLEISEKFDESLEVFYPAKWLDLSLGKDLNDDLIEGALESIRYAEGSFHYIMERAEKNCSNIWKIVFIESNKDVRKHFFGKEELNIQKELIEDVLENELMEVVDIMEYRYNVDQATEKFAECLEYLLNSKQTEFDI